MIFDIFGIHFGAPRMTFRDSVLKWGSQGGPEQKRPKRKPICRIAGIPGGALLGPVWRNIFKRAIFYLMFGDFCRALKKQ